MLVTFLLLPALLALPSLAEHRRHGSHRRLVSGAEVDVSKRAETFSGRLTYYDAGL